jgi:glycosyltransferase involved in cell wall biosynthesis
LLATYLHPNVVHLVYDLFPEAMIHSGKWTEGTLKVKLVRWITKQTLKRATTNVFLGERLKDYVESIHGSVANAAIIAVGADHALFPVSPMKRVGRAEEGDLRPEGQGRLEVKRPEVGDLRSDRVKRCAHATTGEGTEPEELTSHQSIFTTQSSPTILYCGNFGNMHDSETLFSLWRDYAQRTETRGQESEDLTFPLSNLPTFHFCCSGPKRAALETELAQLPEALQQQIQLGGGLDQAAWIATMESADVALVTMVPGSETVVMPSKTYSAMMAGQAILAIAPEDSDLVDLIKAADCGWWVAPGDVAGLAEVIEALSADPEGLLEKRENAFQYAHQHLGQDALAKDWTRALRASDGCA